MKGVYIDVWISGFVIPLHNLFIVLLNTMCGFINGLHRYKFTNGYIE